MRLQALVRGYNVRKQAQMTMRCMQALVRVQARVRARRLQIADEGFHNKEVEEEEVEERVAAEEEGNKTQLRKPIKREFETGGWESRNQSMEKIKENGMRKHDAEIKRERALAYAFACQVAYLMRNTRSCDFLFLEYIPCVFCKNIIKITLLTYLFVWHFS